MARHALRYPRRCCLVGYLARGEAVIADDHVAAPDDGDIGLGAAGALVGQRIKLEEIVERGDAAIEPVEHMRAVQLDDLWLRRPLPHPQSTMDGSLRRRFKRGRGLGGGSGAAQKTLPRPSATLF